jgi:hypothetical protein
MTLQIHYVTVGDTLTPMGAQLKQRGADGTYAAVDLTGLTVKFSLVAEDGTLVVDETTTGVTVEDAEEGKVSYDFQAADVDTAGTYYGWFHVYDSTERDTYPVDGRKFRIEISEAA